ncbi:MAG TPA: hypothetical protein VHT91_36615 [Kofleriaceae bacterium]|nr:hypothetical protein [Kofleriaceae bacterium]
MNARILGGAGLTDVCTANTDTRGHAASSTGASSPDATRAAHLESLAILWIHLATVGQRGRDFAFKALAR